MSRQPDYEQLARVFESHYGLILEAARRYAPDCDLMRDIVQQTYLVYIQGIASKKWTAEYKIDSLLYGIAKRVALNLWKEEQKNSPENLQMIGERFRRSFEESSESPDPTSDEKLAALNDCLKKIPEANRKHLERYYREGVSIEELARENDMLPNTLRQLFCRLRSKLKQCIERTVRKIS